jgi:Zn-dependent peptidase ImmA (M78 family)
MLINEPNYSRVKREVAKIIEEFSIRVPPVDPVYISRKLAINVVFAHFKPSMNSISGFYDADENTIFVNHEEYPLRQTFTIAHELGHKILHEDWAKSNDYRVLLREDTHVTTDPKEKEANAFAAQLLVPRDLLDDYWKTLEVEQLSRLFAVSVPVIKNRIAFEYGA